MVRFAVGLRLGGAAAGAVGAFLGLAPPASALLVGLAVAGLCGWAAWYAAVALRSGLTSWLVAGDVAVVAVLCLGYRWLVPAAVLPGWASWLAVVASSAVVVSQLGPRLVLAVAGTAAVAAAYATGSMLAGQAVSGLGLLLAVQGTGTGVVMWLLRRRVRAADAAIVRQEAQQRDAAVRESRRAEEREHCRLLHDSVSATLTVVAAGGLTDSPVLRAQARRDLGVLERIQAPVGSTPLRDHVDLRDCLEPVVSAQPEVAIDADVAEFAVPAAVGAGLAAAAAEAVRNVGWHAGVNRVSLRAWSADGVVRVELADEGRGFDPAQVPAHRRGLRESVAARMARVGGSATVTSRPGAGTRVVLRWPDAAADPPDPARAGGFVGLVSTRYQRAFELAVVSACGIRHVVNALVPAVSHRSAYPSFGVELAAWAVLTGVGVAGSIRLLRRRSGAAVSWLLAAVALAAGVVATAALATGQELTPANWALGAIGWFGVLVLLRRPIIELATLITLNAAVTVAVLVRDGMVDRGSLARFFMMAYVLAALQVGLALVVRASDAAAARAAGAAERQAAARSRAQVAEALHRSRLNRYETVCRSVAPLLVGLAGGDLDPADPRIQRRCAVEGSRLRRLFAETDDVPDPLLHELRACADIAHSRGVAVDLQVIGHLPALSLPVRRALTEAPLHLLAGARREARVTVIGRPGEVAVSVVADTPPDEPADPLPPLADPAPPVTVQESVIASQGDRRRWIEARWRDAAGPGDPAVRVASG
jgi:signal transduction histidine kinase